MPFSKLSTEKAIEKIKKYCAFQERCHNEVRRKLYDLGLYSTEVEEIITQLIEENFLNEERYSKIYAGSKFRVNKWGKIKISYALKNKKISPLNINYGLSQIDDTEYLNTIRDLIKRKNESLKDESKFVKFGKILNYLVQKGFEPDICKNLLSKYTNSDF